MAKAFLDTNIILYSYDPRDKRKQRIARELLARLSASGEGVVSTQVLGEFYSNVTRKLGVDPILAKDLLRVLQQFEVVVIDLEHLEAAADLLILRKTSYWDGVVVNAALSAGCSTVFSEDGQHGSQYGPVRVINPFLA